MTDLNFDSWLQLRNQNCKLHKLSQFLFIFLTDMLLFNDIVLLQTELPLVSLAAAFVSVIIVITEGLTQAVSQAPVAHQI